MNDIEKALARIKRGIELAIKANDKEAIAELTVTKEALEKQMPKKPSVDMVMDEEFWSQTPFERQIQTCPNCNNIYLRDRQLFCDKCGQAIDWSVEE